MPPERHNHHGGPSGQSVIGDIPNPNLENANTSSLTSEQKQVYDAVISGSGCFITGDAGACLTKPLTIFLTDLQVQARHLMQFIISGLRMKFNDAEAVGVTSSTGVSSLKIGGESLSSKPL